MITYAEAHKQIKTELAARGWTLSAPLKVPHATSADGHTRLWFKTQAIHFTRSTTTHKLNDARSVMYTVDWRTIVHKYGVVRAVDAILKFVAQEVPS